MQILSESIKNYDMWQWLLLLLLLIPASIQDIKDKNISVVTILAGLTAAVIINIALAPNYAVRVFIYGIPGIFLLLCAWITHEAIGYGDGLVMLAIGNIVGLEDCVKILFFSLIMAGVISLVLMIMKKVNRKSTVPFVPFLLIGVMGIGII